MESKCCAKRITVPAGRRHPLPSLDMRSLISTGRKALSHPAAPALALMAVAGIALTLIPVAAFAQAQGLPNTGTMIQNAQSYIKPIVVAARYIIAMACIIYAILGGLKAAKGGQHKEWINVILLVVVAVFALTPAPIIDGLFGTNLGGQLTPWGL